MSHYFNMSSYTFAIFSVKLLILNSVVFLDILISFEMYILKMLIVQILTKSYDIKEVLGVL